METSFLVWKRSLLFLIIPPFIYTSKEMSEDFRDRGNVKRMCSGMFSTPGPIDFWNLSFSVTKRHTVFEFALKKTRLTAFCDRMVHLLQIQLLYQNEYSIIYHKSNNLAEKR